MKRFTGRVTLCIATALVLGGAACGGDDDAGLVTTTSQVVTAAAVSTTTAPPIETTTSTTAASTTTEAPAETAEDASETQPGASEANEIFYRVVRQEATRDGSRLYLEIPPGVYTDVDLENLVLSVYEERNDLYEVHVFDNRDAVEALVKPEADRTTEEAELLQRHYLVSLLEGSILRFQGPFADLEGFVVGS